MQVDLIDIYKKILLGQGILYKEYESQDSDFILEDYQFRSKVFEEFSFRPYFNEIFSILKDHNVVYFQDDFDLNYCFFSMPEDFQEQYHAMYVMIGPVIFQKPNQSQIQEILKAHQLSIRLTIDTMAFYNRIPVMPSFDNFFALLNPLLKAIHQGELNFTVHQFSASDSPARITSAKPYTEDQRLFLEAVTERYKAENAMMHAVAEGNLEAAITENRRLMRHGMEQRVPDPMRDKKNGMLIFNTLLRRSLGEAQIHPYYIDEISRSFTVQIENTNSHRVLDNLSVQMLRKYTMLVQNYSTKDYSPMVRTCINYIRLHYEATINLDILSEVCAISPNYLSSRFRKETGMTISEYLQDTRLNHAIRLLNTESLSIQQISDACGFQDANYFIRVFKKQKGISPNQYRKRLINSKNE